MEKISELAKLTLRKYPDDYLFTKSEVIGLIAATLEGSAMGVMKAMSKLKKEEKAEKELSKGGKNDKG